MSQDWVIRLGVTGAEPGARIVTVRGPCGSAGSEHGQRGIGRLLERLVDGQYPVRRG